MKFLDFEVDKEVIESNLEDIADSSRILVHRENNTLFEKLDYEDDSIFLEPSLFSYFIDREIQKDMTLDQILYGHVDKDQREDRIQVKSDSQGLIYLPNICYLATNEARKTLELLNKDGNLSLEISGKNIDFKRKPFTYLNGSEIKVCYHEPAMLTGYIGETFRNPMFETFNEFYGRLDKSFNMLAKISPLLHSLIKKTHREMYLFNGVNRESLAALSFFGAVLINTDNQDHNEVFFLEDLAHQCGHVIFYTLSLQARDYLKPEPRSPLKKFTRVDWESRDIYGTFHGLFTYTTIIDTLIRCIDLKQFKDDKLLEIYARLGFYMDKFHKDLSNLNNNEILTSKGFQFYDQFKSGYDRVYANYKDLLRKLYFTNQKYIFDFKIFQDDNNMSEIKAFIS